MEALVRDQELSRLRVLVVDDHAPMRAALRDVIARQPDMEVVGEAEDGEQAVESTAALRPDVVIMDVRMPRMDGFEATRRITSTGLPCGVLLVTADGREELRAKATEVGAAGLLGKDFSSTELLAALRAVRSGASLADTSRP